MSNYCNDDSIDVSAEYGGDGQLVLALRRLAQVNYTAAHTGEDPLQVGVGLLELCFTLRLFLIHARLQQLLMNIDKLFIDLLLKLTVYGDKSSVLEEM